MKNNSKITTIAHRGASFHALENTVDSIKKAIVLKADMIEVDVRLTKDNIPVLMHDTTVNRTTDGKGKVNKLTLKEIKKFNTDGEKVPTLNQLLKDFKGIRFNLHIKEHSAALPVIKMMYKTRAENRVLLSSFSLKTLKLIKNFNPRLELAMLYKWPLRNHLKIAEELKLNALHPHYLFITRRFVEKAHKLGLKIHPYTVNDRKMIETLINKGVDGIITDDPTLLKGIKNGR